MNVLSTLRRVTCIHSQSLRMLLSSRLLLCSVLFCLAIGLDGRYFKHVHYDEEGNILSKPHKHTHPVGVESLGSVNTLKYPAGYVVTLQTNPQLVRDSIVEHLREDLVDVCYISSRTDTERTILRLMCKRPESTESEYPKVLLNWVMGHDEYVSSLGVDSIIRKPKSSGSRSLSSSQWGLDRIDARAGSFDRTYRYPADGTGLAVYIVDSGIRRTHSEFEGRAVFGINTSGDGIDTDCEGHGTHVAATVAGKTFGVAPGV